LKVEIEDLGSWKKKLNIEVPAEEIAPYLEKAFEAHQKKIKVEGFRKGKVPMSIIKKRFGKAIEADVIDELLQTYFKQAVMEQGLAPVAPGVIKDIVFEDDKPFQFSAEVEVEPEVEIKHFSGFKVEKEIMKVTGEDVEQVINMLREQKADRKPVDGEAEKGHIIEGDIQALDATGVPIIGEKWENRVIELGQPPLGSLIEDQLLGARKDEERRFSIKQPAQSSDKNAGDAEQHYTIKIKSIQEKQLPDLDDAFAKSVGAFESFSDMEKQIQSDLEHRRMHESEQVLHKRLTDAFIHKNDFELPSAMVQNALDAMWEDYKQKTEQPIEEETFRKEKHSQTVWNLKWHLLWHKLAETQGIDVSSEELDTRIDEIAKSNPENDKKIRTMFKSDTQRNHLKEDMLEQKVFDFLKQNSKIKEVKVKTSKKKQQTLITP